MSNKKFSGSFGGKGYYIALILCAVAIGITGYLYYRNANHTSPELSGSASTVGSPSATKGKDVQAIATQPGSTQSTAPGATQGTAPTSPAHITKTASPVSGQTVAEYAMDALSYNETTRDWRVHNGVDIAAEAGTAVSAAADGTVYTVYEDETMGTTVVLRHNDGYVTKYASLAKDVSVSPGDKVTVGQTIGAVGQTALLESAIGDHVHFSVTRDGKSVNPEDFLALG